MVTSRVTPRVPALVYLGGIMSMQTFNLVKVQVLWREVFKRFAGKEMISVRPTSTTCHSRSKTNKELSAFVKVERELFSLT
jgi:hypothetical protein